MFDVILFSDSPEPLTKTRGYGVYRLATHLRLAGYSCLVVDFMSAIRYTDFKDIIDLAVGNNTLMVGFSTTWLPYRLPGETPQLNDPGWTSRKEADSEYEDSDTFLSSFASAFANGKYDPWLRYIKNKNPKTKLVIGGSKVDFYLDSKLIDHYLIGVGETMTIDLLDKLSGKSNRLFNKIINHDSKAQAPVWDFRESFTSYVDNNFITPNETLALEVGRGCRFKCTFCSYPLIGQKNIKDYLKYSEVIRAELLENYERWGTTSYYIVDDTFNDTTEKLQMFLDVTNSLPFKIRFWCYLRLDLLAIHPEQITMLKEMGIEQCYFGIETFNDKASQSIGKGMKAEKRKKALLDCRKIWGDDVLIQAGFMVGLPFEDSSSIIKTAEWIASDENPIDQCWIFPLSIAGKHESTKYMTKSEMDQNYENWGYYFPDPDKYWIWAKNDDTDIDSGAKAEELSKYCWNKYVKHRNRPAKGDFYLATLDHPILKDREKAKQLSNDEYDALIKSIDKSKLYTDTVTTQYIVPLIAKLRSNRS
jgi:radical SAM superfamily enzyme YgiQ (UPF0313 family)